MFFVEVIYKRPNLDAQFWTVRSQYKTDAANAARAAGDLISQRLGVTEDPLVARYRAVWRDRAAYQRWAVDDPVMQQINQMIAEYHTAQGITTERSESGD